MPFAGREEVISDLDGWLAASGGSFLLLTGAAGLGKSALLLHWMARLLGRGEAVHAKSLVHISGGFGKKTLNILFLPISIRFDTADELRGLKLIYGQLSGLFGELRFPEGAKPDQEDYRDRIAAGWEAMGNRPEMRFVLVIDGADEASGDWPKNGVLPCSIPPNLAIVLAARYKPGKRDGRAWLDEFVFAPENTRREPLDLQPLAKEAVGEAVVQLGHPLDVLPEREGVLDELYRLTDYGDPLLINLWVGQLWKERERMSMFSVAELRRLEPSFRGFLDIWLKEQKALWTFQGVDVHPDDFRRLLRILSLARGPLRLTDLLALMERLSFPSHWDFEHTRKVLESAFRLVVPVMDDTGRQGYAFVHPRLGDHFRMELEAIKEERSAVPRAYLDWGTATVATLNGGALLPEQSPSYLLRHCVAHVLAAELAPDEELDRYLHPLLDRGWKQAWHEEEGAYGGYLGNIRRVQDRLHQANLDHQGTTHRLGQELRCWLIRASVFSLTENIPPELIVALAEAGEWSRQRALRVASQFANPEARTDTYRKLAAQLDGEARQQCLRQALEAATAIAIPRHRADALLAVAAQLDGEARQQCLLQTLEATTAIYEWDYVTIGYDGGRTDILSAVAAQLKGEPVLLRQALEVVAAIDDAENRAPALLTLAAQLDGEARQQCLRQALEAATAISNEGKRARALLSLAAQLDGEARQQCLRQTLEATTAIHEWDYVTIGYDGRPADILSALAAQLKGEPVLLRQALEVVAAIGNEGKRARALLTLAAQQDGEARQQCLHQALEVSTAITNPGYRADVLLAVAAQLDGEARQQCLRQALEATTAIREWDYVTIGYDGRPADVLSALAAQLKGEPELLCQALEVVAAIGDEGRRARALSAVAAQLKGEPALLRQALEVATAIGDAEERARALSAVAAQLDGEARQQCLRQALEAATAIGDEGRRADVLSAVAAQLEGEPVLWQTALREAGQLARGERLVVLAALAQSWNTSFCYSGFFLMLNTMGISSRRDWLELVNAFAPVITTLGGKTAVEETIIAILDVVDWWP